MAAPALAPTPAEDHSIEKLKYQTWVLKVSIHCEGCKRKVKRILQAIEGVYMISVDPKQHKVTVTGNIEPDTLIKKLMRTGKHAEMWPMSPAENERKHGSDKPRGGGELDDSDSEDYGEHPTTDKQYGVRFMLGDQRTSPGKMMQMGPQPGQALPPPANPNGSGGKKKKKKKKKKKSGSGGANAPGPGRAPAPPQGSGPGPAGSTQMIGAGVQFQDPAGGAPNHSYTSQGHYPYQPSHMPVRAPVYAVKYSAVQAERSYGPYYNLNAIQPYSYDAYPEPETYLGPMDSFESINDQNPNWCSIM